MTDPTSAYLGEMFASSGTLGESLADRLAWDQVARERQYVDPFRVRHDFGADQCSWIAACGARTHPPTKDENGNPIGGRDLEHAPGDIPCLDCVRIGQEQAVARGELMYVADTENYDEAQCFYASVPDGTWLQ